MKVYIEKSTKQVLELNEEEAKWLKGLMQNPLCLQNEKERDEDREMRGKFFEALEWS